jgi:hypothetical protein
MARPVRRIVLAGESPVRVRAVAPSSINEITQRLQENISGTRTNRRPNPSSEPDPQEAPRNRPQSFEGRGKEANPRGERAEGCSVLRAKPFTMRHVETQFRTRG